MKKRKPKNNFVIGRDFSMLVILDIDDDGKYFYTFFFNQPKISHEISSLQ
jgi:hypothetical protein